MPKYVLAVKRGKRGTAPDDWLERVRRVPGVKLEKSASADRAQIEARSDALPELREAVGEYCHIEPVIPHKRSDG